MHWSFSEMLVAQKAIRRWRWLGVALVAVVSLVSFCARAADSRIAVLEIHGAGDADKRGLLTDSIRARIAERLPNVTLITRENVLELLKTNGLTLTECECAVATGKWLGADHSRLHAKDELRRRGAHSTSHLSGERGQGLQFDDRRG